MRLSLLVVGEDCDSAVAVNGDSVGGAFLLSAGTVIDTGVDWAVDSGAEGADEAAEEGDDEPGGAVSILVASCSRKDSIDPFVATETFCKNALCLAATSGSLSLADARFGGTDIVEGAVDTVSVRVNLKK